MSSADPRAFGGTNPSTRCLGETEASITIAAREVDSRESSGLALGEARVCGDDVRFGERVVIDAEVGDCPAVVLGCGGTSTPVLCSGFGSVDDKLRDEGIG